MKRLSPSKEEFVFLAGALLAGRPNVGDETVLDGSPRQILV